MSKRRVETNPTPEWFFDGLNKLRTRSCAGMGKSGRQVAAEYAAKYPKKDAVAARHAFNKAVDYQLNAFLEGYFDAPSEPARSTPGMGKSGTIGDTPKTDALLRVAKEMEQNMKPKPSMRSEAQFKHDEELFPRLKIHRKTRAIMLFAHRGYCVVVHTGAANSLHELGDTRLVGDTATYKEADFDDYVGTVTLSNN